MSEAMNPRPLFRIAVDLNLGPGIGQALAQGVLAALTSMEGRIMSAIEELQVKADQLLSTVNELQAQVEEANGKTDQLILIANTTKDALVAARAEIATLQGAGAATAQQLSEVGQKLDAAIAKATSSISSLDAQDAETDAASASVMP